MTRRFLARKVKSIWVDIVYQVKNKALIRELAALSPTDMEGLQRIVQAKRGLNNWRESRKGAGN